MAFVNTFKPTDFTIVIDNKPVTSFGSNIMNLPEPKPEVPQRKYSLNTDYKVAGRSFAEYVTRRMLKDGIGFCPIADYRESATNLYGYIQAPVPKTDGDFLAYCHELGHCKSRQFANSSSYFNATWSGRWSKERLISEVNAWKWGIRYFKRLGFKMTDELVKIVQWSLDGYFKNSEDPVVAHNLSRDFEAYSGIKTETKHIPVDFTGCISYTSPIKVDKPKVKPKGHKPWHDLKDQQMKKAWRNQR